MNIFTESTCCPLHKGFAVPIVCMSPIGFLQQKNLLYMHILYKYFILAIKLLINELHTFLIQQCLPYKHIEYPTLS